METQERARGSRRTSARAGFFSANEKHIETSLQKKGKGLMYLSPMLLWALLFFIAEDSSHEVSASFAVNMETLTRSCCRCCVSIRGGCRSKPLPAPHHSCGDGRLPAGRGLGGSQPQGGAAIPCPVLPCPALHTLWQDGLGPDHCGNCWSLMFLSFYLHFSMIWISRNL